MRSLLRWSCFSGLKIAANELRKEDQWSHWLSPQVWVCLRTTGLLLHWVGCESWSTSDSVLPLHSTTLSWLYLSYLLRPGQQSVLRPIAFPMLHLGSASLYLFSRIVWLHLQLQVKCNPNSWALINILLRCFSALAMHCEILQHAYDFARMRAHSLDHWFAPPPRIR